MTTKSKGVTVWFVLACVVRYSLAVVAIPFVLLLAVAFVVPRGIIWLLAKVFRPELQGYVNDLNALFTLDKAVNFPLNTMGMTVVDGTHELESTTKVFRDRVLSLRKPNGDLLYHRLYNFSSKFLGYSFWETEKNFDLRTHIRDYDYKGSSALPPNPSEADVQNAIGKIISAPWPKNKSPWECLRVENYEGRAQTVVLVRIDHVLADGLSLYELFKIFTQSEWRLPNIRMSDRNFTTIQKFGLLLKIPCDIVENFMSTFAMKSLPFQSSGNDRQVIFSTSPAIPVDVIKQIKSHFKVNYIAVVYAAVCGAIARALDKSGQDVPERFMSTIIIPKPNHPGGLCIHAEMVLAKWCLHSNSAEQRLLNLQKSLQKLSHSSASIGYSKLGKLARIFPLCVLTAIIKCLDRKFAFVNVGISTMPVTTAPDFYEGMEILELTTAINPVASAGITISIGGVNNKQRVSFCVNKNMFESTEIARNMGTFFAEEIQELVKATA